MYAIYIYNSGSIWLSSPCGPIDKRVETFNLFFRRVLVTFGFVCSLETRKRVFESVWTDRKKPVQNRIYECYTREMHVRRPVRKRVAIRFIPCTRVINTASYVNITRPAFNVINGARIIISVFACRHISPPIPLEIVFKNLR